MYIVIEKNKDGIVKREDFLWSNPAPLSQQLKPKEVWADFDPEKHKVIELAGSPGDAIKADGSFVEKLSLREQIDAGIKELPEGAKLIGDDQIAPMTSEERLDAGFLSQTDFDKIKKEESKQNIITSIHSKELYLHRAVTSLIASLIKSGAIKLADLSPVVQAQYEEIKTLLSSLDSLK